MRIGNFFEDKEGAKALVVAAVLIGLIALIAKEMHKAQTNEEKFSEIIHYIVSIASKDMPGNVFDFDSKEISIEPSPILETNKFRYTISGVDRYGDCSKIIDSLGKQIRNQGNSAVVRISKGDLYPAVITKEWSVPEIDLYSVLACEVMHRNKADILIDFY